MAARNTERARNTQRITMVTRDGQELSNVGVTFDEKLPPDKRFDKLEVLDDKVQISAYRVKLNVI